jgi:hypothetical protein
MQAKSYGDLWSKTERLWFSNGEPITSNQRKELYEELTYWYYDCNGAMFLSHEGVRLFLTARARLQDDSSDDQSVRESFSTLRTQLKVDCGFYTPREARKPVA